MIHWHLTEDQGWRIAIDRYPELTKFDAESIYLSGGCGNEHLFAAMNGYKTVASPLEYAYWDFNQGLNDADKVVYGTWWSGSITLSDVYGFDPRRGLLVRDDGRAECR